VALVALLVALFLPLESILVQWML
jgi:hypothetical protein